MIDYNQTARGDVGYIMFPAFVAQIALDARSVPYSDTHTAIIVDAIIVEECFGCGESATGHHFERVYRDGAIGMTVASCDECLPYMRRDDQFREVNP